MMKRVKLVVVLIPLLIIISLMIGMFNQHDFNSIKGIVSLHLSKDKMVEMTGPTNALYYISRSTDADEPLFQLMKQKGFSQTDHQGSSYFFDDGKDKKVISKKVYAKNYFIWKIVPS